MTISTTNALEATIPKPEHGQGLDKKPAVPASVASADTERLAIHTIRCMGADLIQAYKGGHPGTVMGAAAIAVALFRYHMRYNPLNPEWFNRDRFVLSAGHASLLQYLMLHLTGYKAWTMEELRKYHAPVMDGIAAGHPEIEFPGIEVTTGPLGQGIANAVGLAIAGKNLAATYNKEDCKVVDNRVWCFTGDGCLQEGVGQEAASLAGHLGLDNMVLIYDNNSVTIDGPIADCFTDDTSAKFAAMGWHIIDVYDGSNDLEAIVGAMTAAKAIKGKPVLLNIRTVIGIGSAWQGTGKAHGNALGDADIANIKTNLGLDPAKKFHIPESVYEYFADLKTIGAGLEEEWNKQVKEYTAKYPKEGADFARRLRGELIEDWKSHIPKKEDLPKAPAGTRNASGIIVQSLVAKDPCFLAGSADLITSTFVGWTGMKEFQNPMSGLGDYSGRQIRYGIREHAMVAISNGIAAYHKNAFVPITSTFFMFWIYAAPAARMGALQKLHWIGIATHDSIGIGEDGPTHQPVALSAFYRSLPGINFIRAADAEEVMGAWLLALEEKDRPSLILLSRQPIPLLEGTRRDKVALGGYVVYGDEEVTPDITIVSSGGEVARSIEAAELLEKNDGVTVRVVSMPSMSHFDKQSSEYRLKTIPSNKCLVVAVEPWVTAQWPRYAHAGCHMHTFGHSAPEHILYEHFGFGPANLASKIGAWAKGHKTSTGWQVPGVGEYSELLLN